MNLGERITQIGFKMEFLWALEVLIPEKGEFSFSGKLGFFLKWKVPFRVSPKRAWLKLECFLKGKGMGFIGFMIYFSMGNFWIFICVADMWAQGVKSYFMDRVHGFGGPEESCSRFTVHRVY